MKTDMLNQLIETGARKAVTGKKANAKSDTSDFEKMLQQAGQQAGFTAGDTTDTTGTASTAPTTEAAAAATGTDTSEPDTVQMEIAAALVTSQPVIPVDTILPVQEQPVAVDAAAGEAMAEAIAPETQPQQSSAPVQDTPHTSAEQPKAEDAPEARTDDFRPSDREAAPTAEDRPTEEATASRAKGSAPAEQQDDNTDVTAQDASAAAGTPVFEQAANVPVKVAETGAPVEAEAEDAAEQIARQVEQAISQGESKVEITLTPENLGQLTVEITRSGDGTLSIVMNTMTEKAANLLDRHAVSLQNLLADHNFAEVHVEIQRAQEPAAQQFLNPDGQSDHQQRQQQQRQQKDENRDAGDFLQQLRLGLVGLD